MNIEVVNKMFQKEIKSKLLDVGQQMILVKRVQKNWPSCVLLLGKIRIYKQ